MSGNGRVPPGSNLVDLVIISGQSGAGKSSAMNVFEDAGWIVRIGSGRAVKLTADGARALEDQLGVVTGPAATDSPGAAHAAPAGARRP